MVSAVRSGWNGVDGPSGRAGTSEVATARWGPGVNTLVWAVFGLGLTVGAANTVGILASTFGRSSYYPLGERDWRFYVFWGCSHLLNLSLVALGYLQWQTLDLPAVALPAGLLVFVVGLTIVIAASLDLGIEETQGMTGSLQTDGLYRYSRNPQYVGYLLATVAFPVWTGATLTIPLAGIYCLWWLVFPHAEEPWLRTEYGDAYERYAERVPRFVGRQTLVALFDRGERPTAGDSP